MKFLVLLLYTIAYLYIIFEPHISSVTTFLLGITAALVTSRFNFSELSEIVDFNTIFILAGMMIIISILKEHGIFTEISKRILLISKGNIVRTVFLINIAIFFLSGFLDNVTTILIFIPILFYIADAIQIDAKPLLISSVLFSNLGGMTTAIGDPPNIIIYSVSKQSFISFITHLMPVGVVVLFLQLFLLGKKLETHGMNFVFDTQSIKQDTKSPKLFKYLVIFLIVLLAMTFHEQLDIELGIITMLGALVILFLEKKNFQAVVNEIDWDTLTLITGLYLLNFSIEHLNIFEPIVNTLSHINIPSILILFIFWSSVFLSGFLSALPVTLIYISVIQKLILSGASITLYWALALGVGIGGNLTPVASMCNIIGNNLLKNLKNEQLTFMEFTKNMLKPVLISGIISTVFLIAFSVIGF